LKVKSCTNKNCASKGAQNFATNSHDESTRLGRRSQVCHARREGDLWRKAYLAPSKIEIMKGKKYIHFLLLALSILSISFIVVQDEPWNPFQLMEPKVLADIITDPTQKQPLVISIGPAGLIKGAIEAHPARDKENLEKLRTKLSAEPKDRQMVIYCGCCPFKDCPNIRPAFTLLNQMGFKNHKLLNITQNLKVNWIDKGYPMN
jgi:thiosulfate/3-mercaptopyruvate sulfurtransferase